MKASNKKEVELIGRVVVKKVSAGSKSEHDAVCLETDTGSFVLRKKGGHPFYDATLYKLQGKCIRARGQVHNYTFLAVEIEIEKTE